MCTPSADGDPHFVVEFPLSKLTVCFNINGEPGHVLRLVSDHKHSGKNHRTTYFTLVLLFRAPCCYFLCLQV